MKTIFTLLILAFSLVSGINGQDNIKLLPPSDNEVSVIVALQNRKSCRAYKDKDLPLQELSNLLWCANGENRLKTHKRTTPSAWNIKVIDIYVALKSGVYVYKPEKQILDLYLPKDIRANTGTQKFVGEAPVELIYVANFNRNNEKSMAKKKFYATSDASHISQNVYIYCASSNLGTVLRDMVPREEVSELLQLSEDQAVILVQTVGYPDN